MQFMFPKKAVPIFLFLVIILFGLLPHFLFVYTLVLNIQNSQQEKMLIIFFF